MLHKMKGTALYFVAIYETRALVGRVSGEFLTEVRSGTKRIADQLDANPYWKGERLQVRTYGTREQLLSQDGVAQWLHPDVLDRCDAERAHQQEVDLTDVIEL